MSSSSSENENTKTLTENHYSCEFTPMPDPESTQSLRASEQPQETDQLNQVVAQLQSLTVKNDEEKTAILESFDLDGIAAYIKEKNVKNVIFMCGAGISVSAGIPDFRSPETGLFSRLKEMGLSTPEDVFSIDFFRNDPKPFYRLAKELMPGKFRPTKAHLFMKLLQDKDMLLRVYTQNIDSLESQAGVQSDKLIAAHGNFDSARCIYCEREANMEELIEHIKKGEVMKCSECQGTVKPDIVFYGEALPLRFFECASTDFDQCDLLIIMGSSLIVRPFCLFVDHVKDTIPRLLINREWADGGCDIPGSGLQRGSRSTRDVFYEGDCEAGVTKLASLIGLEKEFDALIHDNQSEQ